MFGKLMKPIERMTAVRDIASYLSKEFQFADIHVFFQQAGLTRPQMAHSRYDEDDLARAYLDQASDSLLIDFAEQVGLAQPKREAAKLDSTYWLADHVRVFISHENTMAKSVGLMSKELQAYAISGFVAHDAIKPSAEWREEILRALHSMEVFVAALSPDFHQSKWTDQEVGAAIMRGVPVIPVCKGGVLPYGFIEAVQAFKADGLNVNEVADRVFRTILENPAVRDRMIACLSKAVANSPTEKLAKFRVEKLISVPSADAAVWRSVRENVAANTTLRGSKSFLATLNGALDKFNIEALTADDSKRIDDEVPF